MPKRITTKDFVTRATQVHGGTYDYSETVYVNSNTKVCIICPEHGPFWQNPFHHLKGVGCPLCWEERRKSIKRHTINSFIEAYKERYGEKYEIPYDNIYVNSHTKIRAICHHQDSNGTEHGVFWMKPCDLITGHGCPTCKKESISIHTKFITEDYFLENANIVHGRKYEYFENTFVNSHTKIPIKCPVHGIFYQTPYQHLRGEGCPLCNSSHLENKVNSILDDMEIKHDRFKRFGWLGRQSLDFFLPEYNAAIECQGKQHFEPVSFGSKDFERMIKHFEKTIERDRRKKRLCEENHIKLFYVNYNDKVQAKMRDIMTKLQQDKCAGTKIASPAGTSTL